MKPLDVFRMPVYEFHNPEHAHFKAQWFEYVRQNDFFIEDKDIHFTNPNLHTLPLFAPLTEFMRISMSHVLADIGVDMAFNFTSMWGTYQAAEGKHGSHTHGNSLFAGVYYLHADKTETAGTVFENTMADFITTKVVRTQTNMPTKTSILNSKHQTGFEEGKLLIFPAFLRHHTKPYTGKERAVLAFNMMPVGLTKTDPFDRYAYQDFSNVQLHGDDTAKWR